MHSVSYVNMYQRREELNLYKWHPELVLISRCPYTFEGFLNLPKICNIHGKTFVKMKLVVPFYPNLDDINVYFTENFRRSFKTDFQQLLENSLQNESSLHSFLNQLREYFLLQVVSVRSDFMVYFKYIYIFKYFYLDFFINFRFILFMFYISRRYKEDTKKK